MEVKTLKEVLELGLMKNVRHLQLMKSTLKGYSYLVFNPDRELLFSIILDKGEGFPTCLDYNHVETLEVINSNITILPFEMFDLINLGFYNCPNIKSLPVHCHKLKNLWVQGCPNIEELPGSYNDLESLTVQNSPGIKEIPKYNELEFLASYDSDLIEQAKLLPSIKYINGVAVINFLSMEEMNKLNKYKRMYIEYKNKQKKYEDNYKKDLSEVVDMQIKLKYLIEYLEIKKGDIISE